MNGTDRTEGHAQRSSYFFLSYAHSPPLAGTLQADPDQWVRTFFRDLTDSVERHASPQRRLAPGFFDQEIPVGVDWKASLNRALGTAEVFVPLYSPGYFARSWPGREWACFAKRLAQVGMSDPMRRFAPVLWIPLLSEHEPPGLHQALALGEFDPAYAENGLRAMLRLPPYQASYRLIVDRLAARIVELAEHERLGPSAAPNIDRVLSEFHPGDDVAVFAVAVAAPALADLPVGRDPLGYGDRSTDWRAYPADQELPLAEYAAQVAEQLDFAVDVTGVEESPKLARNRPGVILVDPWFAAHDRGLNMLRSLVREMPAWVLPLLVLDPLANEHAIQLADKARSILGRARAADTQTAERAINGVSSLKEFVTLMPILVTEAERQYLRHGPFPRSKAGPAFWPRLTAEQTSRP